MNEQLLSEFGDYLLSHRGEITAEWAVAIQRGPAISSPGYLGDTELVDHLPELFHNLAASLKSPQSDEQRREVVRTARQHGRYRDLVVREGSPSWSMWAGLLPRCRRRPKP